MGWTIIPPVFLSKTSSDEVVLWDLRDELQYTLRGSAGFIWQLLINGHSRNEVIESLQSNEGAVPSDAVNSFVDQLIELDLLVPDTNSTPKPVDQSLDRHLGAPHLEQMPLSPEALSNAVRQCDWEPAGKHIVCQKLGDEIGALNKHTGVYFKMTGCAMTIWSGIAKGFVTSQIMTSLNQSYEGSEHTITEATIDVVSRLLKLNLIHPRIAADQSPHGSQSKPQRRHLGTIEPGRILIYKPFDLLEAASLIARHTKRSSLAYEDCLGQSCIGVEFRFDRLDASEKFELLGLELNSAEEGRIELSGPQTDQLFMSDVQFATQEARHTIINFEDLPFDNRLVVILLIFKLGPVMFSQQQGIIDAIFASDFDKAADLIEHSGWYHQFFNNREPLDILHGKISYRLPDRQSVYFTENLILGEKTAQSVVRGRATRG